MENFKTNYQVLEERAKEIEEIIKKNGLPERARNVLLGSLNSCRESAPKIGFNQARDMIESLKIYIK